ncbi:questin oxidase family protein [soil metagenome]
MDRVNDVLDEVYERLHATGPEFDGWLSNHGPMAADALLRLSPDTEVHAWIDHYCRRLEPKPAERWPIDGDQWRETLGDASRLGDWLAYFAREMADNPWTEILTTWWPRLLPGSIASATHGLIRTGHAVRSLRQHESPQRIAELGHALGYWAARWTTTPGAGPLSGTASPSQALHQAPALDTAGGPRTRLAALTAHPLWPAAVTRVTPGVDNVPRLLDDLVDAAVDRYPTWADASPIMLVHAATAPRAASLVLPSLPDDLHERTWQHAWTASVTIAAMYRPTTERPPVSDPSPNCDELIERAIAHGDDHVLKFAEVAAETARRGIPTATTAIHRAITLIEPTHWNRP